MRVLFLTNLLPYPLDNGGRIKTYTTLCALKKGSFDVDLMCFTEVNEKSKYRGKLLELCSTVTEIYQRLTTAQNKKYMIGMALRSLFSSLPLSTYKFLSKDMKAKLAGKRNEHYDLIYYDHLPLFVYYTVCKKFWPDAVHLLDEHNCEATIMRRNAENTSNLCKKAFMLWEAFKVRRFESQSIKRSDITFVLSDIDYCTLKSGVGSDFNHSVIPIGVMDNGIKENFNIDNVIKILFVGTLTWEPNNHGLLWFIDYVLPILDRNRIQYLLYIVGKNPGQEVKEKTKGKNVIITGYVPSVAEYYELCDCAIVPLFIGSGQRVKLIEAFSKGMPAISTTIGAEGLEYKDGESILIADTAEKFAESIMLMRNKTIKEKLFINSRKIYESIYSPEAIELKILNSINGELIS